MQADASKEIRSTIFPLTGGRDYHRKNRTRTQKTSGTRSSSFTASNERTRNMLSFTSAFTPGQGQARLWRSSGETSILRTEKQLWLCLDTLAKKTRQKLAQAVGR